MDEYLRGFSPGATTSHAQSENLGILRAHFFRVVQQCICCQEDFQLWYVLACVRSICICLHAVFPKFIVSIL